MLEAFEGYLPAESNEAYHKRPEASSTDVKHILKSPLHFKRLVLEKHLLPPQEEKPQFNLGTSAHECFLEQTTDNFVSLDRKLDLRTKADKEYLQEFTQKHSGKRIITLEQHETLKKMFDRISESQTASDLLKGAKIERGGLFLDTATGIHLKFRPDIDQSDEGFLADYKTTQNASPFEFSRTIAKYGYHISAAHYLKGASRLSGKTVNRFIFIAQEVHEPYAVLIREMSALDIMKSLDLHNQLMAKINKHNLLNHWPDWSEDCKGVIDIPSYAFEAVSLE